jgi:hypothetical protein
VAQRDWRGHLCFKGWLAYCRFDFYSTQLYDPHHSPGAPRTKLLWMCGIQPTTTLSTPRRSAGTILIVKHSNLFNWRCCCCFFYLTQACKQPAGATHSDCSSKHRSVPAWLRARSPGAVSVPVISHLLNAFCISGQALLALLDSLSRSLTSPPLRHRPLVICARFRPACRTTHILLVCAVAWTFKLVNVQ